MSSLTVHPAAPSDAQAFRTELRDALERSRNADGGWAYHASKRSRIEPTCWALLALAQADGRLPQADILRVWPQNDGQLREVSGAPANHAFNAIAALTMLMAAPASPLASAIVRRIVASKGVTAPSHEHQRQDNTLQAWSWVDETFSWVEPTAWCLLVLKQGLARGPISGAEPRIAVAERMLVDRACHGGGWNYGNSNVYGRELSPYVPTTAIALLALQDRPGAGVVGEGLDWLQRNALTERSAVSLSLSLICLRAYGISSAPLEDGLLELLAGRRGHAGDDVLGTAMALYALTGRRMGAFTIGTGRGA
jgi:hypothetical protein